MKLKENLKDLQQRLCQNERELQYRRKINPLAFFENLGLQKEFGEDSAKKKFLFGGNRSGKTEKGAEYVLKKMLAKPKQRWWLCAKTFQDSINIQQRKIWKLLPKNKIKYARFDEVNGFTNRKIILSNGSLGMFKSYDQEREAYQSDDVDGIWFDEEPPFDIEKESRMRLLDRDGEMIFTMTSLKGVTDLIQDLFEGYDTIKSQYAPRLRKTLPRIAVKEGVKFYFLWTVENPHINQARTSYEIKFMTREEVKSRIYGMPINLTGKIYMKFSSDVHVIPFENVPFNKITLYHVLDPHDRKPWAMVWIAMHITGTSYVVDEYPERNFNEMYSDNKTYEEYVKIVWEKEEGLRAIFGKKVSKRIIDPNFGNKTVQLAERQGGQASTTPKKELSKRGLYFRDGIDALEAGHLAVRQALHWESKQGEIVMQPKIFITDNCLNTARHLSRYSRGDILTSDGDVKDKVKPKEKFKDFCDCVRYYMMSNPRYVDVKRQGKPAGDKVY